MTRETIIQIMIVGLAVALVMLTVPANRQSFQEFLSQSFTHQPDRFTELYFSDVSNLSKTYNPEQPITVKFMVHNKEGKDTTYRYKVRVDSSAENSFENSILISNNRAVSVSVLLPAKDYGDRTQIFVELPDQNQQIQFRTVRQS